MYLVASLDNGIKDVARGNDTPLFTPAKKSKARDAKPLSSETKTLPARETGTGLIGQYPTN